MCFKSLSQKNSRILILKFIKILSKIAWIRLNILEAKCAT